MSKAAQGFSLETSLKYVEGGNPRRTPLIGKIAIYGWKLIKYPEHTFNKKVGNFFILMYDEFVKTQI